jgi:transposase
MTRREQLYPEIRRLREDEGLKWREIGERLGLGRSTAQDYYSDPDSSKHVARHRRWQEKDRVAGTCSVCGGSMHGNTVRKGGETCKSCHQRREATARRARVEDVAEMFREGMSYREIAEALGYGPNSQPPQVTEARRLGLIGYRYSAYERDAA